MPEPDKDTPSIERCCWLMTHLPEMDTEPEKEVIGEFGEIVEAAKIAGFNKDKKRQYKMGMDYERLQAAILKERVEEGEAKGRAEGRAEGIAEGEAKKARETAKNMLKYNMDPATISDITGLSLEEIQSL